LHPSEITKSSTSIDWLGLWRHVISAGWQVTRITWNVSSRCGEVCLQTAILCLLTLFPSVSSSYVCVCAAKKGSSSTAAIHRSSSFDTLSSTYYLSGTWPRVGVPRGRSSSSTSDCILDVQTQVCRDATTSFNSFCLDLKTFLDSFY